MDQEQPGSSVNNQPQSEPSVASTPATVGHTEEDGGLWNRLPWIFGILIVALVCAAGVAWYEFSVVASAQKTLPTYFTYSSAELDALRGLSSDRQLTTDDVYRWDQNMFETVAREQVLDVGGTAAKMYAYLTVAQRDFAFLSYSATGEFEGNFDFLAKEIVCIFFEQQCTKIEVRGEEDALSAALHTVVMEKVNARITQDAAGLHVYEPMIGEEYWNGAEPRAGADAGSNRGWFITSGDQFRATPPPAYNSEEFKKTAANYKRRTCKRYV